MKRSLFKFMTFFLELATLVMIYNQLSIQLPRDIELYSHVNGLDQNLIIGIDLTMDVNDRSNYFHYFDDKTLVKETLQSNTSLPTYYYVQGFYLQYIDGILYDDKSPIVHHVGGGQNISLTGNEIAISQTIATQNQIKVGDTRQVNISRSTSPIIIDVKVKHILKEIDFIIKETIKNYVGFDRQEQGIVIYSSDISFLNQSRRYLKFSTNAKSFNYSSSINVLKSSLNESLISSIVYYAFFLLPISFSLYLRSSLLHFRRRKYSLVKNHVMASYIDEVSFQKYRLLIIYSLITLIMWNLLIITSTIVFIQIMLFLNVLINRRIIRWAKP